VIRFYSARRRITFVVWLLAAVPIPILADDFWAPPVPSVDGIQSVEGVPSSDGVLSEGETEYGLAPVYVTSASEGPENVAEPAAQPVAAIGALPCGCAICGGASHPHPGVRRAATVD
jgi:hypothetical protein